MTGNTLGLDKILNALFTPYKERVPDVNKITQAMVAKGLINDDSEILNDHIAFRTLGVPHLGIASFEKIFLHYGYKKKSSYVFDKKKLDAFWYEPPYSHYPRIFLSELRVSDLSKQAQNIISKYTSSIITDPVDAIDLNDYEKVGSFFYKPLWKLPSKEDYLLLLKESEYAAWVIYNRYYLNHYTISVHELPGQYSKLENFNTFLESIGITLNTSGGIVKTSKDGLLKQSSSVAKIIKAKFANDEEHMISGSYVEFAERLVLPEFKSIPKKKLTKEHRRDGFESANADKIFESTYLEQTTKNIN
ncbi:DUF1338 domain-containing protein [Olleya sp. R77988]|uniref:DUF1338 domain-containing protein n=1 Tax=Olleya sp. R77988 TaxID=3093875 RepID=UPI0037CC31E3